MWVLIVSLKIFVRKQLGMMSYQRPWTCAWCLQRWFIEVLKLAVWYSDKVWVILKTCNVQHRQVMTLFTVSNKHLFISTLSFDVKCWIKSTVSTYLIAFIISQLAYDFKIIVFLRYVIKYLWCLNNGTAVVTLGYIVSLMILM